MRVVVFPMGSVWEALREVLVLLCKERERVWMLKGALCASADLGLEF